MRRAAFVLVLLASRLATADPNRVALGTSDPNLKSALFVRGLEVVETPEPLLASSALELARMRADAMNVDAVVWLCDLGPDGRGLCLYDRKTDSLYVRHVPLVQPLSSSDAAGVALSVKYFLAPKSSAPVEFAQQVDTELPKGEPIDRLSSTPKFEGAYGWTLEVAGSSRVWRVGADSTSARVGVEAAWAPERFNRRLGIGMGLSVGSAENIETDRMDREPLSDVTLSFFARGRIHLAPTWLELDLGPAVHLLSMEHRDRFMPFGTEPEMFSHDVTDVSLDARAGVVFPLRSFYVALRGGGFYLVRNESFGPHTFPAGGADIGLALGFGR